MKLKITLSFFLFNYILCFSQIMTKVNSVTNEIENFEAVSKMDDDSDINDQKVDSRIYYKINGKYYKKVYYSHLTPQLFGAKGNGTYRKIGDTRALEKGSDDNEAIEKFLSIRKRTNFTGSHLGGSSLYFPYSVYKTSGAYIIDDHYTSLIGDGNGASIIHAVNSDKNIDTPLFTFGRKQSDQAFDALLTGGGIKDISLITDNFSIRNYALLLDYVEYMKFRDIDFIGFGKSAIKGVFWEGSFTNIKFEGCGTLQQADNNGNPLTGIIDSESGTDNKHKDASNNTLFTKLTFSSCAGTLLKFTSEKNSTVNMNINGIYAETYQGNSEKADDLPLIYSKQSKNNSIINGFITVNNTGKERNGTVIKLEELSDLTISTINISLNPIEGYLKRSIRRLRSFAYIANTSVLSMSNITIADPTDSVGYGITSVPPFFEGDGKIYFDLLKIQILDSKYGGTRRLTNIFDRKLKATGNLLLQPFDINGAVTSLYIDVIFTNGRITIISDKIPDNFDTWEIGDRIEFKYATKEGNLGKIVTSSGTTGQLRSIYGSAEKDSKELIVNNSQNLLVGDWIEIDGVEGYNRIAEIKDNKVILEQKNQKLVKNAKISFHKPIWRNYGCVEI